MQRTSCIFYSYFQEHSRDPPLVQMTTLRLEDAEYDKSTCYSCSGSSGNDIEEVVEDADSDREGNESSSEGQWFANTQETFWDDHNPKMPFEPQ